MLARFIVVCVKKVAVRLKVSVEDSGGEVTYLRSLDICYLRMDQHSSGAPIVAAELPEGADGSSSDFANGLVDQGVLEETDASGSKDLPCRAVHPLTFPRDGHEPHKGALGSRDFPLKEDDASPVGTDVMGPWVRLQANEVLHLSRDIVHMNPACSIISHTPYCLTSCYCVDKLHKRFHYEVDTNFCLHVSSWCSENVDHVTGERWPCVGSAALSPLLVATNYGFDTVCTINRLLLPLGSSHPSLSVDGEVTYPLYYVAQHQFGWSFTRRSAGSS